MKTQIIVGMGFGDEGKGVMTNYFVQNSTQKGETKWVVRYNGGSQAAHNVSQNGKNHCFSQFGAGTLAGAGTFISRFMLFNPIAWANERTALLRLGADTERFVIDAQTPIITPYHVMVNQLDLRYSKHGTCGKGIGELASDLLERPDMVIRAGELANCEGKLHSIWKQKVDKIVTEIEQRNVDPMKVARWQQVIQYSSVLALILSYQQLSEEMEIVDGRDFLDSTVMPNGVVFEGAQGVLLDERWGFHPHTTWTNTTAENARVLLSEISYTGEVEVVGVTRPYLTRHGNGPMMENPDFPHYYHEHNNHGEGMQGAFRYGYMDVPLMQYAADCMRAHGGLDAVAVTHLDSPIVARIAAYCHDSGQGYIVPRFHDSLELDDLGALGQHMNDCIVDDCDIIESEDFVRCIELDMSAPVRYGSHGAENGKQFVL